MPGIVGIINTRSRRENQGALDSMIQCMLHEKFYRSGTFVNERLGLSVGWVSHAGSFSDCMPTWNEERNICLIFSGEDYPDGISVRRLQNGHQQLNGQKAGYLVDLYEEVGLEFLEEIN